VLVKQNGGFKRAYQVGYIVALKYEFKHIGLILIQAKIGDNTTEGKNRESPLSGLTDGCFVQALYFIAVFKVIKEQQ